MSSWIQADKFGDKYPCETTKQAWQTLEEATESSMVEVTAESLFGSSN